MANIKTDQASEAGDAPSPGPGAAARRPRRRRSPPAGESSLLRARARERTRAVAAAVTPAALWRSHRLFTALVVLAIAVRVLATLAFRPALLIPDSFGYLHAGIHLAPGQSRPAGYPILLRVFSPLHSLLLVTTLQHLMGIAMAVIIYGMLRYWGLPSWGATLATVPTLFDSRQIALESYILPDQLFGFVIVVAVAILLTKRTPALWQCVLAGLLLAWASVIRGNGAPIMVAIIAFMLVRRVGWRALAASLAAFAIPLAAYMAVFDAEYGQVNITNSTGIFLWSRTMSFANCAVIKPPANLRPLCPGQQTLHARPTTAWSVPSLLKERTPGDYLWSPGAWWRHDAHPGINAYNNHLATRFALDAIKAQPLSYLRVTAQGVLLTFLATDRSENQWSLHFTVQPDVPVLSSTYLAHLRAYAHTSSPTHLVQPYAYFMFAYQLPVVFPGVAFFVVMLIGLAGVLRRWRRWGGPAALPWAVAAISLVAPVALHEYLYRYAISAVPVACLAAGLAFTSLACTPRALAPRASTRLADAGRPAIQQPDAEPDPAG